MSLKKRKEFSVALSSRRTECCSTQNNDIFHIPIINLSASRRNRSRENRVASKNRLFFPPLASSMIGQNKYEVKESEPPRSPRYELVCHQIR